MNTKIAESREGIWPGTAKLPLDMESNPASRDAVTDAAGVRTSFLAAITVALVCGLIALAFNCLIVQKRQPIFDSLSYLERMHRVMSITVRDGYGTGLQEAVVGNTVCLPYLAALPLSHLVRPARWIGIAFQTIGVALFLVLLDRWLIRAGVETCSSRVAAIASLAALEVVWFPNGGLSDFRMDFGLMLGYGMTVMAAGMALRSGTRYDWILCGCIAAGTCLVRSTAPAYLAAALVPVWLVHAVMGRRHLGGVCLAITACAMLCGWFYWFNFKFLKYYYLVWNTDANAGLAWSQSWRHLEMVSWQAGLPYIAGSLALGFAAWKWQRPANVASPATPHNRGMIAEMLWYAAVPLVLLVGKGAGINPFVSMPAMIALFVAMATLLGGWLSTLGSSRKVIAMCLIGITITGAVARGIKKHGWPKDQYMAASQQIISRIVSDAQLTELGRARFGSLQTCDVHTDSLWGVVLFDRPEAQVNGQYVRLEGIRLEPARLFMLPAQANWNDIPGEDDEQKRNWLVSQAWNQLDYLVIPDEDTALEIQHSGGTDVINRHLSAIRTMILESGNHQLLGEYPSPNSTRRYQLLRLTPPANGDTTGRR